MANPALGDLDLTRNVVNSIQGMKVVTTAPASGHPLVGAFNQGDLSTDGAGQLWVCTVGGNPGTWAGPK